MIPACGQKIQTDREFQTLLGGGKQPAQHDNGNDVHQNDVAQVQHPFELGHAVSPFGEVTLAGKG